MSETLRPWLPEGFRQTGIAGDKLLFAGGTTTQHHTSCTVTYPAKVNSAVNSLLQSRVVLQVATDGFAHHGVFTHQHHSLATEGQTDGLHLLGAHIICPDNEAFGIVIQELLQTAIQITMFMVLTLHYQSLKLEC